MWPGSVCVCFKECLFLGLLLMWPAVTRETPRISFPFWFMSRHAWRPGDPRFNLSKNAGGG